MLSELSDSGWRAAEPPSMRDEDSVVARVEGEPIKAGFLTEKLRDDDEMLHVKYRTGQYDLELKLDLVSGHGQIRVEEAEGYE